MSYKMAFLIRNQLQGEAVDLVESPCRLSILLEADPHEALDCLLKCLPLGVLWLFAGQQ
jgi:hypothetical protein